MNSPYPVSLEVDYPDRPLDRVTTFFRPFTLIPIAVILGLMSGAMASKYGAIALMLLFRNKYPRWWFDWNVALTKFTTRVTAYFCLMRDEYPSTDEEQAVHISIEYPDAKQLSPWMPLVKWFLAIPHYIVLSFLWIGGAISIMIAWFAIVLTGRYPKGLFDFIVGLFRWQLRVNAYAFLLVTDIYPPFSLE